MAARPQIRRCTIGTRRQVSEVTRETAGWRGSTCPGLSGGLPGGLRAVARTLPVLRTHNGPDAWPSWQLSASRLLHLHLGSCRPGLPHCIRIVFRPLECIAGRPRRRGRLLRSGPGRYRRRDPIRQSSAGFERAEAASAGRSRPPDRRWACLSADFHWSALLDWGRRPYHGRRWRQGDDWFGLCRYSGRARGRHCFR